jgi:outer membrane protein assembly factor BamB
MDNAHVLLERRRRRTRLGTGLCIAGFSLLASAAALAEPSPFNREGNLLISDQFNNRVIEINRSGDIVWQFGIGPTDISAKSIVGVNDAQRVGSTTLMAGTGAPPGFEPACPSGCADNRVLLVSHRGRVLWQYGQFGVTGSGRNELNTPVQNTWTPNQTVLITDQGNQRIIEVDLNKEIIWQYGQTGVSGSGSNQLNNPNSAELLENGHILISDENNNRAIEVTRGYKIFAAFTAGGTVSGVAFASRLRNGHTLITDSNNSRIVEVDAHDRPVWEYMTNTDKHSNPMPLPTRAIRTEDGKTIISDQFNHRVIVVNEDGEIVARYGNLNQAGFGKQDTHQGLNGPYDAKRIGDYTGLTPPFGFDDDHEEDDGG